MAKTPWQRLGDHDGLTIDGVEYTVQTSDANGQKLREVARPGVTAMFNHDQWRALQSKPGFQHKPGLHDRLQAELRSKVGVAFASDIPFKQFTRMQYYEDLVLELITKHAAGSFTLDPVEVQRQMDENGLGAIADEKMRQRQLHKSGGLGGTEYSLFKRPCGSVLLEKRRVYLKYGIEGLRDGRFRAGPGSRLDPDVAAIVAIHLVKYSNNPSATKQSTFRDILDAIYKRNERLLAQQLTAIKPSEQSALLRAPDRKTVSKAIDGLDPFQVAVGRNGLDVAIRMFPAVRGTSDRLGPMDRIEYDESKVDLLNLLAETGVWSTLTAEQKSEVKKARMMIGIAIDVVTKCIVAMRIYGVSNGDNTTYTLKMIMQDKTHYLGSLVRHGLTWHQHGGSRVFVMDQGSSNIDQYTRTAISNLGAEIVYAPAADPAKRGVGERLFRTFGSLIYAEFDDRTGSNVIDRKKYMPEDTARLTLDELCHVMVAGAAGLYHNSPHRDLDGRTPAGEWERLVPVHGVPHLPDGNRWRVTFGIHRSRPVSRYGITHCGQCYTNDLIDNHYLHGHGELEIAADPDDLGFISVKFGTAWHEAACLDPDMRGKSAMEYLAACRLQKSIADDDVKKRSAARRAAKKYMRDVQERARQRLKETDEDELPDDHIGKPEVTLAMIEEGERQIFGKYQHAEDDMDVADGALGFEIAPDNSDPPLLAAPIPTPTETPAVKKPGGKKNWSVKNG